MPTLLSLSPSSGTTSGGNSVVISGSGFSGVGPLAVRFGDVATTFTIDSDTRITAIAPGGTGTVQVTVTALLDGTSNGLSYAYISVPSIPVLTSLAPVQGPATGMNTVTITGSGFSGVGPLAVRFGDVATTFTIDSDTRITAIAPGGTGTVWVTVTALLHGTSNALPYTYGTPDTLYITESSIGAVVSVPATGGTPITLATDLTIPSGIEVFGDTLYVAEVGDDLSGWAISIPATGGVPTVLATDLGSGIPWGIAVAGTTIYITVSGFDGSVVSIPLSGGTATTLTTGLMLPTGIEVSGGTLYFAQIGLPGLPGLIASMPTTGGAITPLVTSVFSPAGVAISGGTLYTVSFDEGTVLSAPVSGGATTTLATGLASPSDLAVSGNTLYIVESGLERVVAIPVTGGIPVVVAEGIPSAFGIAVRPAQP